MLFLLQKFNKWKFKESQSGQKGGLFSVGEKGKFCDINFDYYTECSLLAKMSLSNKNSYTNNDIDDDAFLNHPRAGSSGFMLPQSSNQGGINQFQPVQQSRQEASASGIMSPDEKHRQLLLLQKEIEARTVDSSNRSLGMSSSHVFTNPVTTNPRKKS